MSTPNRIAREHHIVRDVEEGRWRCDCDVRCPLLVALHAGYSGLSQVRRAGFPLDADWPPDADECFEMIGLVLYPSESEVEWL